MLSPYLIFPLQGECLSNNECPDHRACINYQCVDPCIGKCATGASCEAKAHLAVCRCPAGQSGDALVSCRQTRTFPVAKYHWDGALHPFPPTARPRGNSKRRTACLNLTSASAYLSNAPNFQSPISDRDHDHPYTRHWVMHSLSNL